jgi:hypothetical protein
MILTSLSRPFVVPNQVPFTHHYWIGGSFGRTTSVFRPYLPCMDNHIYKNPTRATTIKHQHEDEILNKFKCPTKGIQMGYQNFHLDG